MKRFLSLALLVVVFPFLTHDASGQSTYVTPSTASINMTLHVMPTLTGPVIEIGVPNPSGGHYGFQFSALEAPCAPSIALPPWESVLTPEPLVCEAAYAFEGFIFYACGSFGLLVGPGGETLLFVTPAP